MADYEGKDAVELGTSLSTIYTVPSSRVTSIIDFMILNRDTTDRTYTVHFVQTGGSATDANMVLNPTLGPDETAFPRVNQFLNAGDSIQWKASVASKITGRVSILEEVLS